MHFEDFNPGVLHHHIIVTYETEAQGVTTDAIIKKVFNSGAGALGKSPVYEG